MWNPRILLTEFVDKKIIEEVKIEEILNLLKENGNNSLDQLLVQRGYTTEQQMLEVISDIMEYEYFHKLDKTKVPESYCQKVNQNTSRNYNLIGIGEERGRYKIATCYPLQAGPLDEVSALLEREIDIVLAPRAEISSLITHAYQQNFEDTGEHPEDADEIFDDKEDDKFDILDSYNKPFIIRTVNNFLVQALKRRVSDIHLQPYEEKMQIRYRIDGILYDVQTIPKRYQDAVISRIKVMGKMDIAEKRLPQDGRKSLKVGDAEVDVRISSVPTTGGERVVMRLLDKTSKVYDLGTIGLDKKDLKLIEHFIQFSHGIILVTGPTGSGKSTTLYSCLTRLDSSEKNVMTIEDPVEYQLRGISQIQVSEKKKLTFAKGLRTLLRQDPDVIMLGEIRDEETAKIAIQAALTGHMVFSTLHTNDSASAVTRLLEIGIEPYLCSSSLLCVVAQRLLRRVCDGCRMEYEPNPAKVRSIGLTQKELGATKGVLWKGGGCEQCIGTGYNGRIGIYEVLPVNERIREQIMQRKSASIIKQEAVERGLRTLRMDAARKVLSGVTTIEEVLRVTQMDIS